MVQETYVSYEVAKSLREKGFNEMCPMYYNHKKQLVNLYDSDVYVPLHNSKAKKGIYSAPTHQMVMKWLREEHEIIIIILHGIDSPMDNGWVCAIQNNGKNNFLDTVCSYEAAVEKGIEYSLKNII